MSLKTWQNVWLMWWKERQVEEKWVFLHKRMGTQYASKVKWSPLTLYSGISAEFQQVSLNPSPKLGLSTTGGCPPLFRVWTQPSTTPLTSTELWSIKVSKVISWASLVAQTVKNLPAMQETQVWLLGCEDPLEKGMYSHSNILPWRIPWTEEHGEVQSIVSHRVRHNWKWLSMHGNMMCLLWKNGLVTLREVS